VVALVTVETLDAFQTELVEQPEVGVELVLALPGK
jgi:hypothetical protein